MRPPRFDPATTDGPVFTTIDSSIAQYLIFRGHYGRCHRDEDGTLTFTFPDRSDVRADVDAYVSGALVPANKFSEAGRVVRRIIGAARHQHEGAR